MTKWLTNQANRPRVAQQLMYQPARWRQLAAAEIKERTPGVTGVLAVRTDVFDPKSRVLRFSCFLQTAAGATTPTNITVLG